jgi:hypothetical protein
VGRVLSGASGWWWAESASGEQCHGYQCVGAVESIGALGQCPQMGVCGLGRVHPTEGRQAAPLDDHLAAANNNDEHAVRRARQPARVEKLARVIGVRRAHAEHVDRRQRFMGFAYCAKAMRMVSVVVSPSDIRDTSPASPPEMTVAIASKSWR